MSREIRTHWFPVGDHMERLDKAWSAFQQALEDEKNDKTGPQLMTEEPTSVGLGREYAALRDEAMEAAKEARRFVRLEGMSRDATKQLKKTHPPRIEGEDDETLKADRHAGLNLDASQDDLLYGSIIEPTFSSRADYDEWSGKTITDGEFDVLVRDAWRLANVAMFDPKSLPASQTQSSDATSV